MATTTKGIIYPSDPTASADILGDLKKMAESIDSLLPNYVAKGGMIYKGKWVAGVAYPIGCVVYEQEKHWVSLNGEETSRWPPNSPEYWREL